MGSVTRFDVVDNQLQRLFATGQDVSKFLDDAENSAERALGQAKRAVIDSEDKLGLGGELTKSITNRVKAIDEKRKEFTKPLDEAKASVMDAFRPAVDTLNEAKSIIKGKCDAYLQAEQRRRAEEAAAQRRAAEEEARKAAEAQLEEGDFEAAAEIVQQAAGVVEAIQPEKVQATGLYGTSTSGTRVVSGEVTDLPAFVAFLFTPEGKLLSDTLGLGNLIEVKKSGVNKLARVAADKKLAVPGLSINDRLEARAR